MQSIAHSSDSRDVINFRSWNGLEDVTSPSCMNSCFTCCLLWDPMAKHSVIRCFGVLFFSKPTFVIKSWAESHEVLF